MLLSFSVARTFRISTLCVLFILLGIVIEKSDWTHEFASKKNGSQELFTSNPSSYDIKPEDNSQDSDKVELSCSECRITSNSIHNLLRQPRQMNPYGQVDEKIDLEKIKKAVCKDIVSDTERETCRHFFFTHLPIIEKWKQLGSKTSFFDYICIKEQKVCCPRDSFGHKCTKCQKCGLNERCHGEGTRTGSGKCICKEGHTGVNCSKCSTKYYLENEQTTLNTSSAKVTCKPCHKSCLYCRKGGSLGCEVCQKGYNWVPTYGCSDIDECLKGDRNVCGDNTFCVNTEGSYFCYQCDRACDGCYGDGPDMCLKCAKGYKLERGNCTALKKTILPPEANYYRYVIYIGLCVCTCIILHNNVYIASLIGIAVAMYIGISEYIMSTHLKEFANQEATVNPTVSTGRYNDL